MFHVSHHILIGLKHKKEDYLVTLLPSPRTVEGSVAEGTVLEPVAPSAATPMRSIAGAVRRDAKGRPTGRGASPIDVTSDSFCVTDLLHFTESSALSPEF